MATNLIELAEQEKTAAEQRLKMLQEEMDRATQEVARATREVDALRSFIETGNRLASLQGMGQEKERLHKPPGANGTAAKVKVQAESLAGWSAKLLLEKGPLHLKEIVAALEFSGRSSGQKKFSTNVYSAMWRRLNDLFVKNGSVWSLQTKEVEFVK
jgi:hypothetical protein